MDLFFAAESVHVVTGPIVSAPIVARSCRVVFPGAVAGRVRVAEQDHIGDLNWGAGGGGRVGSSARAEGKVPSMRRNAVIRMNSDFK